MRCKEFYDYKHASMYLDGCVIRKAHIPIIIQGVQQADLEGKKWRIDYRELASPETNMLFLPNRAVNMNPVPLGMINGKEEGVWFVSRQALRQWKVGLSKNNIVYHDHGYGEFRKPEITSAAMRDCILGTYPQYDQVVDGIRAGKRKLWAFSRRFCLNTGNLLFKSNPAPVGIAERGAPVLFDQYDYLKEMLEEDLDGNNR